MNDNWTTKPTDRFVLKWIKQNLSARITPRLIHVEWLRPWMITLCASSIGVLAGLIFALGRPFAAGCFSAFAQVMDGVDGQFSRITGLESKGGAFLDSVLDRYSDTALMIGMVVYLITLPAALPIWLLLVIGFFALCGSTLISYSTARAESLGIDLGSPTLASKGTRTTVIVFSAWLSVLWPSAPLAALIYLAAHPNFVIVSRLLKAGRYSSK